MDDKPAIEHIRSLEVHPDNIELKASLEHAIQAIETLARARAAFECLDAAWKLDDIAEHSRELRRLLEPKP